MAPRRTIERARALQDDDRARGPSLGDPAIKARRPAVSSSASDRPFVLDFYCAQAKLAIEIDGLVHDMGDRPARDAARDYWLVEHGITTLRFAASTATGDHGAVVAHILERCAFPLHHPADGPPPHAMHGEDE